MIGRLLVGPEIGRGGYAVVRQALEPDQQRQLAWKELREEKARQAHLATAHQAEAWIVSSTSHPSIPHVYAYLREHHAFVMDFIPGVSLDRLLEGWRGTPMEVRSRLVTDLVGAVVEIHRRGFLHLDLKLANLLLTPHGNLYLIDFGVAALHWMNTHAGTRFPLPISAGYTAPEMVARRPVYDQRADVYSLAVVLYVLLTGKRPYRIDQADVEATRRAIDQVHERGIPPLREADPQVPAQVERAVLSGMRHSPEDRPPTVMVFGRRVVESLREVGMADMATMEAWSAEILVRGENRIPAVWDGSRPLLQLSVDEAALEVSEPVLVTRVESVEIEPAAVAPGEEVMVTWRPVLPGESYEIALLGPGDLRPRTLSTRSCPHLLKLERAGTYRLHVRAVNGGLRGAWSPEAAVEVARPGMARKGLVAAGGGLLAVLLAGGVVLFLLGGPSHREGRTFPTPTPVAMAAWSSPTPAPTGRARNRTGSSWVATRPAIRWVPTAAPAPTSTPTAPPVAVPTRPVPPAAPLAGRVVQVISAGKGGLQLRAINDVDGLHRSLERVDGRCLRLGENSVRLHVRDTGRNLGVRFHLSEEDLRALKKGKLVQKDLEGGPGWNIKLKVRGG